MHWRKVLRARPGDAPVLTRTAWLLATCPDASLRDGAEAVALAERASRGGYAEDPDILDTLAAAYAESGRFSEALRSARKAFAIAKRNKQSVDALAARIALYDSGRPFREQR
jgi:hypothetical protein